MNLDQKGKELIQLVVAAVTIRWISCLLIEKESKERRMSFMFIELRFHDIERSHVDSLIQVFKKAGILIQWAVDRSDLIALIQTRDIESAPIVPKTIRSSMTISVNRAYLCKRFEERAEEGDIIELHIHSMFNEVVYEGKRYKVDSYYDSLFRHANCDFVRQYDDKGRTWTPTTDAKIIIPANRTVLITG